LFLVGALAVLLLLLPSQAEHFMDAGSKQVMVKRATLSLATRTRDNRAMLYLFGLFGKVDMEPIRKVSIYLKRNDLAVFHLPWTHWLGTQLSNIAASPQTIKGGLSYKHLLGKSKGFLIRGWMANAHPRTLIV